MTSDTVNQFEREDSSPRFVGGWTVIYTRPNHEKTVAHALTQRSIHCYLPLYREVRQWSDRTKVVTSVLFPNYVFAKLTAESRTAAIKTMGVAGIVSTAGHDDLVEDQELAAIRQVLETDLAVEPASEFVPGEPVVVERGPLAGVQGHYVQRGKQGRIFIRIELLRRGLSVPVEEDCIRPLKSSLPLSLQNLARALRTKPENTDASANGSEK